MKYHATKIISESFDSHGVKYRISEQGGGIAESVDAGFSIRCGPQVVVHFLSSDDDNDVSLRVFCLVGDVPEEKRARLAEACNYLNHKVRYVKFGIDGDGDVNVEYDFPQSLSDEGLGEAAFELFVRTMRILDAEYQVLMKALYTEEDLAQSSKDQVRELIEQILRRKEDKEDDPDGGESPEEDADAADDPDGPVSFEEFLRMAMEDDEDADDTDGAGDAAVNL